MTLDPWSAKGELFLSKQHFKLNWKSLWISFLKIPFYSHLSVPEGGRAEVSFLRESLLSAGVICWLTQVLQYRCLRCTEPFAGYSLQLLARSVYWLLTPPYLVEHTTQSFWNFWDLENIWWYHTVRSVLSIVNWGTLEFKGYHDRFLLWWSEIFSWGKWDLDQERRCGYHSEEYGEDGVVNPPWRTKGRRGIFQKEGVGQFIWSLGFVHYHD